MSRVMSADEGRSGFGGVEESVERRNSEILLGGRAIKLAVIVGMNR